MGFVVYILCDVEVKDYRDYKNAGGELKWNDFVKHVYNKSKSHHT